MKTNFPKQFFKKGQEELKKLVMTAEEKRALYERLSLDIPDLPSLSVKSPYAPAKGWLVFSGWTLVSRRLAYVVVSCAVILFTSSGLAFAAESSLPGDPLYKFKIKVTEPIMGALAFNQSTRVQWESDKVERRLQEVEALAAKGDLDMEKRQELEKRLDANLKTFADLSKGLEKEAVEKAQNSLDVAIKAHTRVLERIEDHATTEQREEIRKFTKILIKQSGTKKIPTGLNQHIEQRQKAVDEIIQKTDIQSQSVSESSDAIVQDIVDEARGVLKEAQKSLDNSRHQESFGEVNAAYDSLFQSERSAEEAKITLKQGLKLGKQKKAQK